MMNNYIMTISYLLFFGVCTLFLPACTSNVSTSIEKLSSTKAQDSAGNVQPPPAVAAASSKCASGKAPQILTGDCTGKWRVAVKEGKANCVFDWGPEIRCPSGTTPIGYAAVCYGATEKPYPGKSDVSPKDCNDQFGPLPAAPAYTLSCCGQ